MWKLDFDWFIEYGIRRTNQNARRELHASVLPVGHVIHTYIVTARQITQRAVKSVWCVRSVKSAWCEECGV